MRASYLEIYNEEIRDLLGKDPKLKLDLKEKDGVVFVKVRHCLQWMILTPSCPGSHFVCGSKC